MTNNKQSSLEWLNDKLASLNFDYLTGQIDNKEFNERHKSIIEQAKAMHKEEMINFTTDWHHNGLLSLGVLVSTSVEEHYNKIFKQ